jgi:Flp pilus assembly protein TadG
MTRRRHANTTSAEEDGMTTLEVVILAPVLMGMILFVVFLGRITTTQQNVQRAARDAARAGSLTITRDDAETVINTTLAESLGQQRTQCQLAPVDLTAIGQDTGSEGDWDYGTIQIRLTCNIPTSDLGLLALGTKTFTAIATEPVDTWRSRKINS